MLLSLTLTSILAAGLLPPASNTPLNEQPTSTPESINNTNIDPLGKSDFDEKHVYYPGYAARIYVNRYPINQMPSMVTVFNKKPKYSEWQGSAKTGWKPKTAVDVMLIYTPVVNNESVYRCIGQPIKDVVICFDNRQVPYHLYSTDFDRRKFKDKNYKNTCTDKITDFNRTASFLQNATNSDAGNDNYHHQLDDAWIFENDDTSIPSAQQFGAPPSKNVCGS